MMSTLVLQNGWNISCLIPEYQNINYHDRAYSNKLIDDILWSKNSLGREIQPYESIFIKTERGIGTDVIDTLTDHYLNINDMRFAGDKNISIAICFHLGYGNMYPQFAQYIRNVYKTGYHVDLYVTYQKTNDPINLIAKDYPNAIFIQTTRGLDTGAFLMQLESIYNSKKNYDYIFKIHTKKKEDWRFELLDKIAGNTQDIVNICDIFKKEPEIGMIGGCQKWIHIHDKCNEPLINEICQRIRVNIDKKSYFIGGTIFWTRWSVFKKFIKDSSIDFKKEYENCELGYLLNDLPTFTHSWERIFGYIVCHYNLKIVSITNLEPSPLMSNISKGKNIVVKVSYGLSEKQSIDVTDLVRQKPIIRIRNANTASLWGDPYPEKRKKLFITFNTGQTFALNECTTRLTPNNFIIQNETYTTGGDGDSEYNEITFKLEDNDNYETLITLKHHDYLGRYVTTFFDWLYYYDKYSPWLSSKTYTDCIQHYMRYGLESNLLTFNPGESLINKYKIKLIAYYVPYYNANLFKQWKPSYKNHQIYTPTDNYKPYDINTLRRNIELARTHGITGFCFQHYWEKGQKLMYEAAETLFNDKALKHIKRAEDVVPYLEFI